MIRATGIDISKWDWPYTPKAVDFVIQRLSYGLMRDERLAELTPLVIQAPVKGAYHYYSSGSPWQTQMDFFLGLEGGKYDFLCLDIEKLFNTDSSAFVGGIVPALNYLKMKTGKPAVLYVNPDCWNTWLSPIQKDLLPFDLWIAQYYTIRRATDPWLAPTMRKDWRIWQWNDKPYDQDVFNGTVDDLHAWCHPVAWKVCPTCGGSGKVPA